ncbi:MAG: NAD(P)H-hydrate epimerase [Clostridiales bacterium]|nr:MAG: NAD(P)H-hydrate epimerase [Clostridiales bacterium]
MRILTAAEMRQAEARAVQNGTSYEQLMENAGVQAAQQLTRTHAGAPRILFLCGKGNNGGDALVMARLLTLKGWAVSVSLLCGEQLSELAVLNRSRLPEQVRILPPDDSLYGEITRADLLVDAVFGIGFHGELPEPVRIVFREANASNAERIALDLPSGINSDTGEQSTDSFRADQTFTFGAYKPALLLDSCQPFCGEIICLDIGL